MASKKSAETAAVNRIYLGPSLPQGQLKNAALLRGTQEEIDSFLGPFEEKYGGVKALTVDVEETGAVRARLRARQDHYWAAYQKVSVAIAKEGK